MIPSVSAGIVNLILLFAFSFLSSLGIPAGTVWMISSGALANSAWDLLPIMAASVAGAIVGDLAAYEFARRFSDQLLRRLERLKGFRSKESRAWDLFKKAEFSMIFFTRFLFTGLCAVTNYLTGFARTKRRTFIAAVVAGELLYGTIYPAFGYLFKETWNSFAAVVGDVITVLTLLVLAAAVLLVWHYRRAARG